MFNLAEIKFTNFVIKAFTTLGIDSLRQSSLGSQALCVYCLVFGPESRRPNFKTCPLVHLKMTKKEADLKTR